MAHIYELKEDQQKIVDELFFLDPNDDQDQEQITLLYSRLANITGSVENKLEFLVGVLCEVEANESGRKALLDKAQKRFKIASNVAERIRKLIKETMIEFNIKKISSDYADVRIQDGREIVFIPEGYDCKKLPEYYVTYAPESYTPKKRELTKALKEGILIEGLELVRGEKVMVVS
jgi:hypothetical protein